MCWEFQNREECYYINWWQMTVCKGRARHSLKGRLYEEEIYETYETASGSYHTLYKTHEEALEALRAGLRSRIVNTKKRLQELEVQCV